MMRFAVHVDHLGAISHRAGGMGGHGSEVLAVASAMIHGPTKIYSPMSHENIRVDP